MKLRIVLLVAAVSLLASPLLAKGKDDIVRFGRSIVVEPGETAGDLVCIGCSIHLRGTAGDAVAVGGSVEIEGTSTGDVVAVGGRVRLAPNASVKGDVVAAGGSVDRAPDATVGGSVEAQPFFRVGSFGLMGIGGLIAIMAVPTIIGGFLMALLVYAIAGQRRVHNMAQAIRTQSGMALLAGLVTLAVFVMLTVVFSRASVLTALLEVLCSVAFAVLLVVGYTGLSYAIGARVAPASEPMGQVALGALIVIVLQLIPIVNIVTIVFVLLALGCAVLTGLGSAPDQFKRRTATRAA